MIDHRTPPFRRFAMAAGVFALLLTCQAAPAQGDVLRQRPTERLYENLAEIAIPVDDPEHLDPLYERIGDARAVLLGEASHGTREYYTWRTAISKHLIKEMNFSFLAVEGDWNAFVRVNRYVKDLPGAAESGRDVLKSFDRWPRWMWANEEVLDLIEWLREYNLERPKEDRIGIYGIDIYGYAESLEKAPRYLKQIDEDDAAALEEAFECFVQYADSPEDYLQAIFRQNIDCETEITEAVERLRREGDRLREKDRDAYFHAKQNALVVKSAEKHQRTMLARDEQSWNTRAQHFHDTFKRLLDRYGEDSRGIVWAHNTHIGDAHYTVMRQQRMINIGQLARAAMGEENVVLVGFGTHRGDVIAGREWRAPRETMPVPPAVPGSLEDIMHRLDISPVLFITNQLPDRAILRRPIGHRAIGVTYSPGRARRVYVPTIFPRRYDAFIFFEETTTLNALPEEEEPGADG